MPTLKRYKAWVEVDGSPLPEYKVEEDADGQTVRCWIPSEAGKNFEMHWSNEVGAPWSDGKLYVDGRYLGAACLGPKGGKASVESTIVSETARAKLQFGTVNLTDDDSLPLEDEAALKTLGTIRLSIQQGQLAWYEPKPLNINYTAVAARLKTKAVHEKMKKGGGHRLALGEEIAFTAPQNIGRHRRLVSNGSAPINFIFQYQPRDMLRALGIMQREAEPAASTGEPRAASMKPDAPDDDSADDERDSADERDEEEAKRLEARLAELRSKKRPSDESNDRKPKKAKTEQNDARSPFRPGEVIDLT